MKNLITCIGCSRDFTVAPTAVTVELQHDNGEHNISGFVRAHCPQCKRKLFYRVGTSVENLRKTMNAGAELDIVALTAQDLADFQHDLQNEDFLSEIADYECYSY